MILELDFASKTIKVKGTIKVSEVMEKIKELRLEDWSFQTDHSFVNLSPYIPTYPSNPFDIQPYYGQGIDSGEYTISPVWATTNNC